MKSILSYNPQENDVTQYYRSTTMDHSKFDAANMMKQLTYVEWNRFNTVSTKHQ